MVTVGPLLRARRRGMAGDARSTRLDGVIAFDGDFDSSRNVFRRVGEGCSHFSDQHPRDERKGAAHHIGIRKFRSRRYERGTASAASIRRRCLAGGSAEGSQTWHHAR